MNTENSPVTETSEGATVLTPTPEVTAPEATVVPETPAVIIEEVKYSPLQIAGAVLVSLLILGGAGYFVYTNYYANGGIVAVVNGKEIYQKELDENVAIISQNAAAYGIDPATVDAGAKIREQSLEILVTSALLLTAASAGDFSVTDEAVDGLYQKLVSTMGGEEALRSQMAAIGLTEEKLRNNIRERELVNQYLAAATDFEDVTASEEEVAEFVAMLESNNVQLPPLEEVRPQIEEQIKAEKQQKIVDALVEKLRGEADIEIR